MSKDQLIEIFCAGKHTDSEGQEREWTETDLDKIVTGFNKKGEDIAWTLGHPKTDSPAWAWAKKLIRKGKSLFADMRDTTPELSLMLKRKMFKKRSIALRPDFSPRHIALLGAHPPAIKGLEAMAFADGSGLTAFGDDDDFITFDNMFEEGPEFTDDKQTNRGLRSIARIFRGLRDRMIEKDGLEKANMVIPDWDIENINDAADPPSLNQRFSEEELLDFSPNEINEFAEGAAVTQTLILSKDKFKKSDSARKWIKDHKFSDKKIDETEESFRFRQREPGEFKEKSFRTKKITEGVSIVIGRLKNPSKQMSEPNKGDNMDNKELENKITDLEKDVKEFGEKVTTLEEENKTLKTDKEKVEKEFSEYKENESKEKHGAWFDEQVKAGRQLPANKDAVVATMMRLDGQEAHDFAEKDEDGNEKKIKKTELDMFKESIEGGEPVIEYGESYTGDKSSNKFSSGDAAKQIRKKADEIMKADKSIKFGEALSQARDENPELAEKEEKQTLQ